MKTRRTFRPTAWDALEERQVLSVAGIASEAVHALTQIHVGKSHAPTHKAAAATVGALGDSYTDEYKFYAPDRSTARNWVEILAATRHVDFGKFSNTSLGEPRDAGFSLNWARSGATSADMIDNQLPGLAAQVAQGQVTYAWIFIGGNDFRNFITTAEQEGPAQASQILTQLGQVESDLEANFTTAVDTLLAASPNVKLVVATLPDISAMPSVQQATAGNPGAQLLVGAIGQEIAKFNTLVRATAAGNSRIAVADLQGQASQLLSQAKNGSISYGGTTLNLTAGDNDHDVFLADGIHAGTVVQGVFADTFVNAIDSKFGAHVKPLSPKQIVQFASHVSSKVE